ncbi:ATP-binding protein [Mesobacillus sp. AQ2]|jgi:two-component system, OmpR family, sensor histidine kinase ResE|uniref:ATP-binding protein n=1 Tax=Bacillaceae TaxID=186817 RepID=UPI0011A47B6B|nr:MULTISPECIES: ATP-binding protein [Bacillaceae]MCM3122247.1 ATP-binding protein [Mesobacillus sp. MER 33]MCM3232211.1 ATP-binding protein [Mesobacillus sp. MER 48]WHX39158.1 ATP-binding protein [Mesobacillus sp. AQ2]
MMFWRSVVGKLWITILLLVSFVLFILTVMLMEFFENYHINETRKDMTNTAEKIARVLEDHPGNEEGLGLEIAWEMVDDNARVTVIRDQNTYFYSPGSEEAAHVPISFFTKDKDLSEVFERDKTVDIITSLPGVSNKVDDTQYLMIGVPLHQYEKGNGAVFIYQSLAVMQETTRLTTKFILLAAGVAIVLTTIFAFFLSTRITSPLRKMREAAFEVARGKFDTKVPILTHDEIGELATAFNQMGRQLKFNMNALSQEKEQLTSILSSMADGVITFNRDGTILITNPPAEIFLRYWYYEQGLASENTDAVPSEVMELFQLAVNTEKEQVGEITAQGRTWVIIVSPLYNKRFIRGAVAVVRDMTEERKLDKMREDFIANVSHELRTPISMMQGYSEAIVDDIAQTDEEKKEMAKVIYDESLRMGRLVNELLDLARMQAGHILLNVESVELEPYINRVIRKFQGLAKDKGIDLSAQLEAEEPHFRFDPDRIEQVLTNLIDNAIRHVPDSAAVDIKARTDERGLYFEVSDQGPGIPEEDLPFLFERFYKGDKSRTRGVSGTGLGLAIAKNIIDAHRGIISVKSKLGQGTTFSFFIPRNIE